MYTYIHACFKQYNIFKKKKKKKKKNMCKGKTDSLIGANYNFKQFYDANVRVGLFYSLAILFC